jgi:stage V sporulation protein B
LNKANTAQQKKASFLSGAIVLAAGGIFAKFLGMFFRIPLASILGDVGFGYFTIVYPLYSVFLSISTVGLPTAVSKMVSERASLGNYRGAAQVMRLAFVLLSGLGLAATLLMLLGAKALSLYLYGVEETYYSILALAPAPFLIAMLSAYRGYMQGMQKMSSTSISQIVDQVFRVGAGVGAAYLIMQNEGGLALAAGGASFGATAGALASFLYMAASYGFYKRNTAREAFGQAFFYTPEDSSAVYRRLFSIALPIAFGGLVTTVMGIVNSVTVLANLQAAGIAEEEAVAFMGALDGKAQTLVNVPFLLGTALSTSLVPSISASYATGETGLVVKKTSLALKLAFFVSLPASVGLSVLAGPIMVLIFGEESAKSTPLLAWLSYVVVFTLGMTALQGVLQGAGHYFKPIRNLIIGVAVKFALNVTLIRIPDINIFGAIISSIAASAVIFALNLWDTHRLVGIKGVMWPIVKILFCTAAMGIATYYSYSWLSGPLGPKLAVIPTIAIAIGLYGALSIATGAVSREELSSIRS